MEEIGKLLEHLNIDDIDDIVKNSEKQLDNLEKIETNSISTIKKLEQYLIEIKNKLYLLEGDVEDKVRKKIIETEKRFDKIKSKITKSAESLLKDIKISPIDKVE